MIVHRVMNELRVYSSDYPKCRVGSAGDGGYVIADIGSYDILVSCGISDNIDFEIEFCSKYSTPCIGFDGTVSGLPSSYSPDKHPITFIQKNISVSNTEKTTNLQSEISEFRNIFLKMDVETFEFRWFNELTEDHMNKFKQIVVEFHFPFNTGNFTHLDIEMPVEFKMNIFKKINKTHTLVHFHANNCCGTRLFEGVVVPNVFECTYVRNDIQTTKTPSNEKIPSPLDFKNTGNPEIFIDYPPFVG